MVSQNLVAVMEKYGFVQLVSRPTRVTDHSATLIDHAYTNDILNTTSCHVITANISDHLATVTTLYLGSGKNFRREKVSLEREQPPKFRKFNEACNAEFRILIQDDDWTDVFNEENSDELYNKFSETYTKIYNQDPDERTSAGTLSHGSYPGLRILVPGDSSYFTLKA